jgi:hypothetical protein
VPSHDIRDGQGITDGTVLIPTGGRGSIGCAAQQNPDPEGTPATPDLDCRHAFITVAQNALVQGLVVYYQEQGKQAFPH